MIEKTLERMAYKMQPAGHERPQDKRKYEKPQNKLKEAYEKWLGLNNYPHYDAVRGNENKCWNSVLPLTKNLELTLADVHGLLIEYGDDLKPHLTGLFASALYRKVPEKEIIFDLPLEQNLHYVGLHLPEGKTLISRIPTGHNLGQGAAGTIVNESHTWNDLGINSTGIVINYGDAGENVCSGAKGPIINYGGCNGDFASTSKAITVNLGRAGTGFADGLQGTAINLGIAREFMGRDIGFNGLLVNYGKAGPGLGDGGEGTILCFKNPESYGEDITRNVIKKPKQCAKYVELRKYLDNLKIKLEKGRNDYKVAIELAKQLNEAIIEQKLPKDIKQRDKLELDDMPDMEEGEYEP